MISIRAQYTEALAKVIQTLEDLITQEAYLYRKTGRSTNGGCSGDE